MFPQEGDSELELVAPCPPFPSTSSEAAGGLSIVSWLCSATTIEVGGQGAWACCRVLPGACLKLQAAENQELAVTTAGQRNFAGLAGPKTRRWYVLHVVLALLYHGCPLLLDVCHIFCCSGSCSGRNVKICAAEVHLVIFFWC